MAYWKIFKNHLTLGVILLIAAGCAVFIFSPVSVRQIARAVTGDYSKVSGTDQLTASDWNNLPNDFLDKQNPAGDTMAGPLTLPADPTANMHAATRQYVDNSSAIHDPAGNPLRMYCGVSSPANWEQYEEPPGTPQPDELTTYVDTSASGFSTVYHYISSLQGTAGLWRTTGGDAIYEKSASGFRVYIDDYNPQVMTPAQALAWDWRIQWCAVGD